MIWGVSIKKKLCHARSGENHSRQKKSTHVILPMKSMNVCMIFYSDIIVEFQRDCFITNQYFFKKLLQWRKKRSKDLNISDLQPQLFFWKNSNNEGENLLISKQPWHSKYLIVRTEHEQRKSVWKSTLEVLL